MTALTFYDKQLWQVTLSDNMWEATMTGDTLWQSVTSISDTFWQLLTTFDDLWQETVTTFDNLWQESLTTFDNLWQATVKKVTVCNNLWQATVTICDKLLWKNILGFLNSTLVSLQIDWSTTHYCQQQKAVVVLSCFRSPKYDVVDTKLINNCKGLVHGVVGSVCARHVELRSLGWESKRPGIRGRWSGGLFMGLG